MPRHPPRDTLLQVHEAFAGAWEAADAVPREPGMDERAYVNARRAAAEAALKSSLGGLGLNVQVGVGCLEILGSFGLLQMAPLLQAMFWEFLKRWHVSAELVSLVYAMPCAPELAPQACCAQRCA